MSLTGKLKGAAVVTVALVGFHAYQTGAVAALAHHGGSAASIAAAPAGPVTRNANEALANRMAASGYGWTGSQATCLDELWTRESGFSNTADTRVTHAGGDGPGSVVFAYGIAQARPATKYPKAGQPSDLGGSSDPATQVRWGLRYLKDVYGSPCAAWGHETANSWY